MGHPRNLFHLISTFPPNVTILTTNISEKCQFNLWCWDLNPQPSKRKSVPITTRQGLSYITRITIKFYTVELGIRNQSELLKAYHLDNQTYIDHKW